MIDFWTKTNLNLQEIGTVSLCMPINIYWPKELQKQKKNTAPHDVEVDIAVLKLRVHLQ
jgi:hypothetical protein